jgi:hypothetical protein
MYLSFEDGSKNPPKVGILPQLCYNPEKRDLNLHRHENLKSRMGIIFASCSPLNFLCQISS